MAARGPGSAVEPKLVCVERASNGGAVLCDQNGCERICGCVKGEPHPYRHIPRFAPVVRATGLRDGVARVEGRAAAFPS